MGAAMGTRYITIPIRNLVPDWKKDKAREMRRNMTPAEKAFKERVKGKQLGVQVRTQHVIRGYIADFYIPLWRLIIEIDGGYHSTRAAKDKERDANLARLGFTTVRFTNEQVLNDIERVLKHVKSFSHLSSAR